MPMHQQSIHELLRTDAPGTEDELPKGQEVYDLFCGAGGFSCGAALAGCRVAFACDSCPLALETHKQNHPEATHLCAQLPAPLPLPTDGRPFHLHGSPPCQQFSTMKTFGGTQKKRVDAANMVEWYLELALRSGATSWSMEQVSTNGVVQLVERVRQSNPGRLAYHVFDLDLLGVPQTRKRLIAGTPWLVARLVRMCSVWRRRPVNRVIHTSYATHLRNSKGWETQTLRHIRKPGQSKYVYSMDRILVPESDLVRSVTLPGPTVVCTSTLRWAWWERYDKVHLQTVRPPHLAALQTFPPTYVWPEKIELARRQIGNALPPLVAELMLRGTRSDALALKYPMVPLHSPGGDDSDLAED